MFYICSNKNKTMNIERIKDKSLLIRSIEEYNKSTPDEKKNKIKHIESSLEEHERSLDSIGMGYSSRSVRVGKQFLRYIKLYKQ